MAQGRHRVQLVAQSRLSLWTTGGGLTVAGTASIVNAGTQLVAGDASGAADWLSAGVSCWALAILRR